jgi:hypothetical protein
MLFKLGVRVGYEPSTRNGPRANRRSNQECAASCIMFCHVELLPLFDEPGYPGQYQTGVNDINFSGQCHRTT